MNPIEAVKKSLAIADARGEPYVCATVELKRKDLRATVEALEEAQAEAAECIEFLRNLSEWHEFWQEGFLGSVQKATTRQNAQKLRAFLDETNHARRFVERLDAEHARAERAEAALAKLQQTREMDLGRAALLEKAERAEADAARLRAALERSPCTETPVEPPQTPDDIWCGCRAEMPMDPEAWCPRCAALASTPAPEDDIADQ
jgi:GTP1/Obg family GTP-binding protein